MKKTIVLFLASVALPLSAFALSFGIGANLNGGLAGALAGDYGDQISERYAALGASSFSAPGSSSPMPAFVFGGNAEFDINDLLIPRFGLAVGLGYGLWGWGIVGKDSAGQSFASTILYAPLVDLSLDARYSFRIGNSGWLVPGIGVFIGNIFPGYMISERISGVSSTIGLAPIPEESAVIGIRLSCEYAFQLGPGTLKVGVAGALGQSLAIETGSLGGSILIPWRSGLEAGYIFPLKGMKK